MIDDVYKAVHEGHSDSLTKVTEACREKRKIMLKRL